MNTYEIIWDDAGNRIYRNLVMDDPRPSSVQADDYELLTGQDGQIGGIKFFRGENTEPFLIVFDIPLMVTRVGA